MRTTLDGTLDTVAADNAPARPINGPIDGRPAPFFHHAEGKSFIDAL